MGDRKSSSIRLSFFSNHVHFPACERLPPPAASAEIRNKATCSRVTNFIRAFILETFHPSRHKSHVLQDPYHMTGETQPCGSSIPVYGKFRICGHTD
jgi:hypothetical protein